MPMTLIDGVEIYYESHGDGAPLVLTYCVGGNAGPSSAQYARLRQMILSLNPIGFAHTMRALSRNDFPPERLAAITAPTLLVAGEYDPALEPMRVIHRHIPHAHFVLLPEAGHLANLDQPEQFQHAVLDFVRRVEASAAGCL